MVQRSCERLPQGLRTRKKLKAVLDRRRRLHEEDPKLDATRTLASNRLRRSYCRRADKLAIWGKLQGSDADSCCDTLIRFLGPPDQDTISLRTVWRHRRLPLSLQRLFEPSRAELQPFSISPTILTLQVPSRPRFRSDPTSAQIGLRSRGTDDGARCGCEQKSMFVFCPRCRLFAAELCAFVP